MHASITVADHTHMHGHTHAETHTSVNTIQTVGDGRDEGLEEEMDRKAVN